MFAQVINHLNQSLSRQWRYLGIFFVFQEYFDENTKSYFFFCCEGYRDKSKSLTVIMFIILHDESISGAHPGHRDPWDECTCKT